MSVFHLARYFGCWKALVGPKVDLNMINLDHVCPSPGPAFGFSSGTLNPETANPETTRKPKILSPTAGLNHISVNGAAAAGDVDQRNTDIPTAGQSASLFARGS